MQGTIIHEAIIKQAKDEANKMIARVLVTKTAQECDDEMSKLLVIGLELLANHVMNSSISKGAFSATRAMEKSNYLRDKIYEISRLMSQTAHSVTIGGLQ